ncbi:ribosomal protein S6 kinase-like 1 isoform X1 [Pleurodeles waltl]|uniref:ribosomal protein S6 kinase-like 1 isoform X1 n=1 Tax=Pleurodeles waltl TaxID=8319 RepID=UPI00370999DD
MNRSCKERQLGPEAETCSRALSQARVYIEQIRSRVSAGGSSDMQSMLKGSALGAKRDYLVDAAKQIRLALERDVSEDYEAAFNHYKNGVDLLLGGIQVESNKERREAVKRKVAQYLKRAEEIFNSHLQRALGNGLSITEGYSSLRFRPIRSLSSPIEHLSTCKVVGILDKVQLVQDPCTGETFVLKSLPKSLLERREQQTIIPQGVPYMVKLLRYYVSEDSIFLRLQHVQGGKLWSHLRRQLHPDMERGKEYPECSSPFRKTIKLKNSYTTPSMSSRLEEGGSWWHWESRSTWDGCSEAMTECDMLSPTRDHLSPGLGQSPDSNQSTCWDERSSQSSSQEGSTHGYVVGCGSYSSIPSGTVCIGPINNIREVAQRQGTRLMTVHPTSLTDHDSHLSQREPTKENGSISHSVQDLWSPESQALVDSFRNLQGKLPPIDHQCPNGRLAQDTISRPDCGLRISSVVNVTEMHQSNSKMVGNQNTLCLEAKDPDGGNTTNGKPLGDKPLDCTETHCTLLTDWHSRDLNGKEANTVISGSAARMLPAKNEHRTTCALEAPDMKVPASLGREGGTGTGLVSPDASPDIEVDGWCFVSAPPPSTAESRSGAQGPWGLSEQQIRLWASELLLALEGLHQQGVICQDLNPRNVLLDDTGHICLTYFGQWPEVELQFSSQALEELYAAPEVRGITGVTEACDWWSFGALLYELLTGMSLSQNHPSGIHAHTRLCLPDSLSCAAASLLTELLQCDPDSRLGSGADGINKIKSHPFFRTIHWNQML